MGVNVTIRWTRRCAGGDPQMVGYHSSLAVSGTTPYRPMLAVALAVSLLLPAAAYTYDVVLPRHTPWSCFSGRCANWSGANATVQSYWGSPRVLATAGSACAMPAKAVQGPLSTSCDGSGRKGYALDGWCLC